MMSKRTVFTTITPLPATVTRETAMATLHDHLEMIDLNPAHTERHQIPSPPEATPEEYHCTWYAITDTISYFPGYSGKVSFKTCFHDLPNGLQTHTYAPMGLDIKEKWTLGGNAPNEPVQPVELGIGAPISGLYLREDVEMKCNFLVTRFVRKTLKECLSTLVARMLVKTQLQEAAEKNKRLTYSTNQSFSPPNSPPLSPPPLMHMQLGNGPMSPPMSPPYSGTFPPQAYQHQQHRDSYQQYQQDQHYQQEPQPPYQQEPPYQPQAPQCPPQWRLEFRRKFDSRVGSVVSRTRQREHIEGVSSLNRIGRSAKWIAIPKPTGAIDDLHKAVSNTTDDSKRAEGKKIVEELAKLKYELQHDRKLTRLATSFSLSQHWKSYDVFAKQKMSTFRSSRPAVLELASRYHELITQMSYKSEKTEAEIEETEKILFMEMCEICLWGNATDLSLLTSLTYEDIQKLQGSEARKASEKNIIVNDLEAAYSVLKKAQKEGKKERRVDIVLDNAGFELYVDLILAGFLLSAGLATNVILHPKSIPWFVSDVLPADFAALLNAMASPQSFYSTPSPEEINAAKTPEPLLEKEIDELSFLFQEWSGFHAEGQLMLRSNRFWTEGGSYWRLPTTAPSLFEDFKESELVIFKGDLNYRKLTGDANWHPTTPFTQAIGPMGPGSGVNVLALRTCKADVVVGLPAGKDEELRAMEGGGGDSGARKWAWNGKWAIVSFSPGA
ncbi:hypothetical protein G7Y89_g10180 [Cudoniella acicularis]|uniref:Sugar phosphate phosphatase n=1 Tax=Cudoniella acicularis TaxID=354080 RepID=A0A8H4VZG3_9HELO|nr:hypothetical protein G7Y89_g10180 [Cudoniella acicularis]